MTSANAALLGCKQARREHASLLPMGSTRPRISSPKALYVIEAFQMVACLPCIHNTANPQTRILTQMEGLLLHLQKDCQNLHTQHLKQLPI